MNLSDRIAIMNSGRVEQVGRPVEIYNSPASNFIARFLGEANLIEGTVETIGNGRATLRTAAGVQFQARAHEDVPPGASANLFVRPERVAIVPAAGEAAGDPSLNRVEGRLVDTSFLGNILRHAVEIAPGVRITVDVQNSSGAFDRTGDQLVRLSWRPADGVILAR